MVRDLYLLATLEPKGERLMPYKDITYDNGFTERFYFDETEEEEALRMSRINSVAKFPSANHRSATRQNPSKQTDSKPPKFQDL
jgi:hypothetical protein